MKRIKKMKKRWILLWVVVFGWGAYRIYSDHQLAKIGEQIQDDHRIVRYSENLSKEKELQEILEKDFFNIMTHTSVVHQKDAYMLLKSGRILGGFMGYGGTTYKETVPYKIAYFYELPFFRYGKEVWTQEQDVEYLDVLTITLGRHTAEYKVSVSDEDMNKIKEKRQQILEGKVKLRPKNIDEMNYAEIEDKGFYTLQQNEGEKQSPYMYFYAKKAQETNQNIFTFRYKITDGGISEWQQMSEPRISLIDSKGLFITEENKEMLEKINNRTKTPDAPKEKEINLYGTSVEDLVVIEGPEDGVKETLVKNDFNTYRNAEWLVAMGDPSIKAKSVSKVIVDIRKEDVLALLDKYAEEHSVHGREELKKAEKIIRKDLEAKGTDSDYYKWINEFGVSNWATGDLVVDFGKGIVNLDR